MPSRKYLEVDMWDVLVTLILLGSGALILVVGVAIVGWAVFWMQNGGRDD